MKKSNLNSFVPTFVIYINNIRLALEKEILVKEILISENINFPSKALIVFSDMKNHCQTDSDFMEGNSIQILLGYKDQLETLFDGVITGKKALFYENLSLTIKCVDPLFYFDNAVKVRSFYNINSYELIKKITGEYSFDFEADIINIEFKNFIQYYKTDLHVLHELLDYDFGRIFFMNNKLFIKKITNSQDADIVLEWGKSLSELNADLDCRGLITESVVKSWNYDKTEAISGKAVLNDLSFKLENKKSGQELFSENFGDSSETLFMEDLKDNKSCEDLADIRLIKNSFKFINAKGKSQGNNNIKTGEIIKIKGAGDIFSGNYLVKSTRHILSEKGYMTEFDISKNC